MSPSLGLKRKQCVSSEEQICSKFNLGMWISEIIKKKKGWLFHLEKMLLVWGQHGTGHKKCCSVWWNQHLHWEF